MVIAQAMCTENAMLVSFRRNKVELNSIASQSLVGRTTWTWFGVSLVIISFSLTEQTTAQWEFCPLWFIPDNGSIALAALTQALVQLSRLRFPLLHFGFCMAYNNVTETMILYYNNTTFVDNNFNCNRMCWVHACVGHWIRKAPYVEIYMALECNMCWGHGNGWLMYFFLHGTFSTKCCIIYLGAWSSFIWVLQCHSQHVATIMSIMALLQLYTWTWSWLVWSLIW